MVNPPPSLKPSPVIDIEHHLSHRLFHRGFHLNKCIFKATGESKYQGAIDFKLEFDHLTKKAGQSLTLELPYQRFYFWLGVSNNSYKAHVDFGNPLNDKRFNLYVNAKQNNESLKRRYQFGTTYVDQSKNARGHARFEIANKEVSFTTRGMWRNEQFLANFVETFNLSKFKLTRFDYSLAYNHNKFTLVGNHYLNTDKITFKEQKNVLKVSAFHKYEGLTYGCRYKYDVNSKQNSFVVAARTKVENYRVNGKANLTNPNLKMSVKGKFNQQFAFALSAQLPFGDGYKDDRKLEYMPFPVGFSIKTKL